MTTPHRCRDAAALMIAVTLTLVCAAIQPTATQNLYTATPLGTLPGGLSTGASGINAAGQVVGSVYSAASNGDYQAFLWQNGTMIDLGTLGGTSSMAAAINDSGQVVGTSTTATRDFRAFLWRNGTMIDLGMLGGTYSNAFSVASAINDSGQVVGRSTTFSGHQHAFLWQNGTMIDLGTLGGSYSSALAINNSGQVVGWSSTASEVFHAFLWQKGTMIDLGALGGGYSVAQGINNSGQVAGYSETPTGVCTSPDGTVQPDYHAVLWENGAIRDLDESPDCSPTYAVAINNAAEIVGGIDACYLDPYDNETYCYQVAAFLHAAGVTRDLNQLTPGFALDSAAGINDCGQIVANGGGAAYRLDPAMCATAPPPNLTATAGNASVVLGWAASAGATSYTVRRATASGGPFTAVATGLATTSYTNVGLTNGATYYYVVQAVNAAGTSPNSNIASATPTALPGGGSARITANGTHGSVTLGPGQALTIAVSFTAGNTPLANLGEVYLGMVDEHGTVLWIDPHTHTFVSTLAPAYTGKIGPFAPVTAVYYPDVSVLAPGRYCWVFIVDNDSNGTPNLTFWDFTRTTIQ